MRNKDVFIGLSVAGLVNSKMVKSMAADPVIFALANPVPEIMPGEAKKAGARVVATGRSNLPNQINNALGFPGIFRGALDARAQSITEEMKIAASYAISDLVSKRELRPRYIIPNPLDKRVVPAVASAVRHACKK
jgi:malate dehydrogenase (oxaloacetate-decarboxylating)